MSVEKEVVKFENVWAYYNSHPALQDINLAIHDRDFLGIIGPNGGGKTTLLKIILGLLKPRRGKVTVLGKDPCESRSQIGYVPQKSFFDKNFPIDVWQVTLMGLYSQTGLFRRYSCEDKKKAEEALDRVSMLKYRNRQIGELSGGQQKRVFIARALASDPKLLLLDEPMESVDPKVQGELYGLLKELQQEMAIVLVSHDVTAVSIYVDEIACLNQTLVYHGPKEISDEVLEGTYQCPIHLIAHGTIPHRVLKEHQ
ncbi:MAG: ABC transporter ATP-binding protein [Dehalococcoidales bacterium]|nr:ABC transporter ATP-binding protein [Dehalococcoidales bacterium]